MMRRVFEELGYRRYEWKCDSPNMPSRRAAERLGFTFEGVFRQAVVYKGRNRDSAWFSIIDREWPPLKLAYERWLAPENFDANGRQRSRLADLIHSEAAPRVTLAPKPFPNIAIGTLTKFCWGATAHRGSSASCS
jgi:hypothetical protein